MESLRNYVSKAEELLKRSLMTVSLASVLTFSATSCGESKSSNEIGYQIRSYITSRKDAVEKYNKLYAYPQNETNKSSIEKVKADLYDEILSYDEKIEDLAHEKIKAETRENENAAEHMSYNRNTGPLDPNKYDFLLDF